MIIRENLIETISNSMITYKFKNSNSTSIESTLFKYFEFPLIETTRTMMSYVAIKSDFDDIMHLTWFCHKPVIGQSCGLCNPCEDAVLYGFAYRLSKGAILRFKIRMIHPYTVKKRLKNTIAKTGVFN